MSVRMRHTHAHTRNRRSHHALAVPRLSTCEKCNEPHVRHTMCANCGTYKGREVINVMTSIIKKEEKKKEKREAKSGIPEKKAEKKKEKKTKAKDEEKPKEKKKKTV